MPSKPQRHPWQIIRGCLPTIATQRPVCYEFGERLEIRQLADASQDTRPTTKPLASYDTV